jgi:hypothetical protein
MNIDITKDTISLKNKKLKGSLTKLNCTLKNIIITLWSSEIIKCYYLSNSIRSIEIEYSCNFKLLNMPNSLKNISIAYITIPKIKLPYKLNSLTLHHHKGVYMPLMKSNNNKIKYHHIKELRTNTNAFVDKKGKYILINMRL